MTQGTVIEKAKAAPGPKQHSPYEVERFNRIDTEKLSAGCDLRWMGSGPHCGLGELVLPEDGLTSSIMPGKRNPTIAEVMVQAAMQVAGNHVTMAAASDNPLT
ncbi:hypothetical protein RM96_16010 [Cupriavidus sp. IDO]|nr:hypothetical protein RM96_16010 [Cupriavidus sp. IDO]